MSENGSYNGGKEDEGDAPNNTATPKPTLWVRHSDWDHCNDDMVLFSVLICVTPLSLLSLPSPIELYQSGYPRHFPLHSENGYNSLFSCLHPLYNWVGVATNPRGGPTRINNYLLCADC